MQTLQIDPKKAKQLFPNASSDFREMLIDTFGEKFFSQKITDRVKSFEDACAVLGINEDDVIPSGMLEQDAKSVIAYCKLAVIARALNEGWKPDWVDSSQYKWFPYFEYKSGFGFSGTAYDFWNTYTTVGSRLCFHSSELAEYAGKQFISIYQDYLTL